MSAQSAEGREGGLDAPTRNPIEWKSTFFYDETKLFDELCRVFDLCHGCRRCFNLCRAFPILFDLVDESETYEVDGVNKKDYWKVINNCYLCDMCYIASCPYVPPHEWNIDFPMLMLRAKAFKYKSKGAIFRDNLLSKPELLGKINANPFAAPIVNFLNQLGFTRGLLELFLGISKKAPVPQFQKLSLRSRLNRRGLKDIIPTPAGETKGKVALFTTCYGQYNHPSLGDDLVAVFEHNEISVTLVPNERCCGMPRFELGDISSVDQSITENAPQLASMVDDGYDIVIPMPSCAFMQKHLWPLIRPEDENVKKVSAASYDPFEYLMARHAAGKLKTDFKSGPGHVAYHAACHIRAQNMGLKTKEALSLLPDVKLEVLDRCSGHDGTYAVKEEFRDFSENICRPVSNKLEKSGSSILASDCPMAAANVKSLDSGEAVSKHPLTILREAYGV
ncbi:MAG TPA: heterodisulfide reductase-related iron-sulfur binding cluster [Nitrospinota bacterium]|nr:heterodisulfide reductase-related iron-sulfur binding cluster [Nitrospinota bacterium]|tara:strand:- start:114218 stop:115564 length:1347 start_codon:yes stop_codon:yes gene_type:complete